MYDMVFSYSITQSMILIADSGSTKTNWCLTDKQQLICEIDSAGINPYFQSQEDIRNEISKIVSHLKVETNKIEAIYFYGAGCTSEKIEVVRNAIEENFETEHIEVGSDLLGAARGICGKEAGIACILGTGSNSCFYNGSEIEQNISPLGFILGDEGSGAVLGKLLVGDLLKNILPTTLKDKFFIQFNLTPAQIIEKVYRQPFPNRFLAGLSPFLAENIHEPAIYQLVLNSFKSFFDRNVKNYDYQNYTVNFVGSVAFHYKNILTEAAKQSDIRLGYIEKSPMNGLINYHT